MMPLWTRARLPSPFTCGWALTWVGVGHSRGGREILPVEDPLENEDLALLLDHLEAVRLEQGHAGRIVATVLQALEPLDEDG